MDILPHPANSPAFVHHRCPRTLGDMKTPQQLSRQDIDDFKAIYLEEFGQTLSDDEVQEIAFGLLRFFGILLEPQPGELCD